MFAGHEMQIACHALLGAVLVAAAVLDVRTGKIPNALTYPAIVAGLMAHTLVGGLTGNEQSLGLAGSAAGLATGFLPMLVAHLAGGIGGGDAKLMGAVGALAGWQFALSALFFGLAVAALMSIVVILHQRVFRRTIGRVWRYLLLSFVSRKPAADPAAPDSPKIPMGLAFCLGSALAMIEVLVKGPGWLLRM